MKRKVLVLIFMVGFLMNIKHVDAVFCDYTELAKYKRAAMNIEHEMLYDETSGKVTFEAAFYNLHPDIYIKDLSLLNNYVYDAELMYATVNLQENKSYRFVVTTDKTECQNKELRIITVDTPKYNPFYTNDVCKDVASYYLCNRWSNHTLNQTQFVDAVNLYKKSLEQKQVEEPDDLENLLNWWSQNYFYLLSIIIVLGVPTIYYLYHKNDFDLRT